MTQTSTPRTKVLVYYPDGRKVLEDLPETEDVGTEFAGTTWSEESIQPSGVYDPETLAMHGVTGKLLEEHTKYFKS